LAEHRGIRNRKGLDPFTVEQILDWADAHFSRWGEWPTSASGLVPEAPGETWGAVQAALSNGIRGLPGGSSLPQLLAECRSRRNHMQLPPLSLPDIFAWADQFFQRSGRWPNLKSGPVLEAPDETWYGVNAALNRGGRGLPGGSSLACLLAEARGARNHANCPGLNEEAILAWAQAHFERHGNWPTAGSGPIPEAPGETWRIVEQALQRGLRGLPGGSSIARLLGRAFGKRNPKDLPRLTLDLILTWADEHHGRTGRWPKEASGPVQAATGENWKAVSQALTHGLRGLPGGSSLARLLAQERGARNHLARPRLTRKGILAWARAHFERTGAWPTQHSGPVADAPEETWTAVNLALQRGGRGLPGGSSLPRLLAKLKGKDE
jgi:hypothetical protein